MKSADDKTMIETLLRRASETPGKTAFTFIVDGEEEEISVTYGELDRKARAIAAALVAEDLGGRCVALLYPPGLDFIAAFFGALYAGSIAVPAPPPDPARLNQTLPAFLGIVRDSQAKALLTTATILGLSELVTQQAPSLSSLKWIATDNLSEDLAGQWAKPSLSPQKLAILQYTSGSTGNPKGVMLSHQNILENIKQMRLMGDFRPEDRFINWIPLTHNMGLIGCMLVPASVGIPSILMSPIAFLESPLRWLRAISRRRGTVAVAPNFAYDLCWRAAKASDLGGLKLDCWEMAISGGEPARVETMERFAETFSPCGFRREAFNSGLGISEAALIVSGRQRAKRATILRLRSEFLQKNKAVDAPREDETAHLLFSCGEPIRDHKLLIVDPETLLRCAENGIGEIWLHGDTVAEGYWNRPEETLEIFGARLENPSEGPFLRTGDLGFLRNGELFVTGRLKELIIIRGHNHYPQDIEKAAEGSDPAVRPWCGAAFSVDSGQGEQLVIVCELEGRFHPDIEKIALKIRESVSRAQRVQVSAIEFVGPGSIPKTRSGKIQRLATKKAFLKGRLDLLQASSLHQNQEENNPILEVISAILKVPAPELDLDGSLTAYGLDSLSVVQLAHELEDRFGLEVRVSTLFECPSIRHLINDLTRKSKAGRPVHRAEVDLRGEIALDPSIIPPRTSRTSLKGAVLLTGATGFLGAFLLDELLRTTNDKIYCTVRAGSDAEALERLENNLRSFSLWDEKTITRVIPVRSDLSKPLLGLSESAFSSLSESIDAVYHNGAAVNFLYAYKDMKDANVLGTQEILRLASAGSPKKVHYISTLSVFPTAGHPTGAWYREDDDLDHQEGLLNGYAQSKWVAEKILQVAKGRGLPITVYRVGEVIGHSLTGVCRPDKDVYSSLLKGCLELGCAPDLNVLLYPVPVDYVVSAIVHLSRRPSCLGRAFHLTNPTPLHNDQLFELLETAGFPLRRVSYDEWMDEIARVTKDSPRSALAAFVPFLRGGVVSSLETAKHLLLMDCRNTLRELEKTGIRCGPVTLESLAPYISYLMRSGFMTPPGLRMP